MGTYYKTMVISSESSCQGYWDPYDSKCLPCSTICVDTQRITECTDNCKDYIQTTMISQESVKDDIHKLTIMVAAMESVKDDIHKLTIMVAAMTSLVLFILFFMVVVKVNKKKRKAKGILPYTVYKVSSDEVDIKTKPDNSNININYVRESDTSTKVSDNPRNDEPVLSAAKLASSGRLVSGRHVSGSLEPGRHVSGSLEPGRHVSGSLVSGLVSVPSVATVTTQLSDETVQNTFNRFSTNENTTNFNGRGSYRASGRGKMNVTPSSRSSSRSSHNNINNSSSMQSHNNINNMSSRLPSEDCVIDSEGGCHNLAMDSSPTSTNSPQTHSQVV